MSHRIAAAFILLAGPALAQNDPQTVGVSVDGTVVEVAVEVAAEACGMDAGAILTEWETLSTELSTMSDTTVGADATDLAPAVEVDTPMDATIDGVTVADGADATHGTGGAAAQDVASDVMADTASDATSDTANATGTEAGNGTLLEAEIPEDGSMDAGVEATADAGAAGGDDPATADIATGEELAAAGTGQAETSGPATPTEGTVLSKAAVCEISKESADEHGISVPG